MSHAYRIDHIGVAVASIDEALEIYRALGLAETHREEVPSQKVTTAFLPVGESRIELLQPTEDDSPVGRFLARRGPGIHHLCFTVSDLNAAVGDLSRRGFRLVDPSPAPGAEGRRVVFLHPGSTHGVLIELSEAVEEPGRERGRG